jgi:hypothetical protein
VARVSTGGVHVQRDRPFAHNDDPSCRVIPKGVPPSDPAISR